MEAAWRHTDTLIFQSRYQEILMLVQDDPLEDLMRVRMIIRPCSYHGDLLLLIAVNEGKWLLNYRFLSFCYIFVLITFRSDDVMMMSIFQHTFLPILSKNFRSEG